MNDLESKVYQLESLIRVCLYAAENETSGIPFEERGIAHTLEFAASLAAELTEKAGELDQKLKEVA